MSTYNELVVNSTSNSGSGGATMYTVPAGRRAEVTINASSTTTGGTVSAGGQVIAGAPGITLGNYSTFVLLEESESVSISSGTWHVGVKEFSKA